MRRSLILLGCLYLASSSAFAAQGEVCVSKPASNPGTSALDNATVFHCNTAGTYTVPQLYDDGWRVVAVFPQTVLGAKAMSYVWTLVIEKV